MSSGASQPAVSVLVTAVGGNVGQGVVKALRAARRRFRIVGVDMEPLSAGFSMVDAHYVVPRTGDDGFRDALSEVTRRERIEAIYVCSPPELTFFAAARESLERELGLVIFVNPLRVVEIGADKLRTAEFLRTAGLPYPRTVDASDAGAVRDIVESCGFPLVVKPRGGSASKDVFVMTSAEQLDAARVLVRLAVVQQYLGDESGEYTATALAGPDHRVRALIVLRRHLLQGTTYRTELTNDDRIHQEVIRVFEALGTVGVSNIQFRLVDGRPVVFEINPRFSGTAAIRYHYGFNDAEMVFDLLGLGLDVTQPALRPAVVMRLWQEVVVQDATFDSLRAARVEL